jgi:hypothetical protein
MLMFIIECYCFVCLFVCLSVQIISRDIALLQWGMFMSSVTVNICNGKR